LIGNGRLYSPHACVFVSQEINSFINEHSNANGLWPVGVSKRDRSKINKYEAHCNVFAESRQKKKFLGSYFTPEEAHQAWKVEKLKQAKILAATVDDQRIAEALIRRYS
jgi:hypothetical protein